MDILKYINKNVTKHIPLCVKNCFIELLSKNSNNQNIILKDEKKRIWFGLNWKEVAI